MILRRGQVVIYLVLVLVGLTLLMLLNVNTFIIVRSRNRMMNAGDAAALAAARIQAELLNEIGRLNLRHAEADAIGDYEKSHEIVLKQMRLAFLGPLQCLRTAQEVAKLNGAERNDSLAEVLRQHALDIHQKYMAFPELYPEPWEGAWGEYAAELSSIASGDVFAGADNAEYLDVVESFPLTAKSFYKMILGNSFCKLKAANWMWLLNCDSKNMPRPQSDVAATIVNSEICSLHLIVRTLPTDLSDLEWLFDENGASFPPKDKWVADTRQPDDPSRYYFFYDCADSDLLQEGRAVWRKWWEMDRDSQRQFPIRGRVKPVFDVLGCSSVFRVISRMPTLLDGDGREFGVAAAAKPFGAVVVSGERSVVTDEGAVSLVFPSYETVRLIPIAAANANGSDRSMSDLEWLNHVRDHVNHYLSFGVNGLPASCTYCQQLVKWENPDFRAQVARDLQIQQCAPPTSGPSMPGGGAYPLP